MLNLLQLVTFFLNIREYPGQLLTLQDLGINKTCRKVRGNQELYS